MWGAVCTKLAVLLTIAICGSAHGAGLEEYVPHPSAGTDPLRVDPSKCTAIEATCSAAGTARDVVVHLNGAMQNSSVHIPALHNPWNLSGYASVSVDVTNLEPYPVVAFGRLDGHLFGATSAVFLAPNATAELLLHIDRPKPFPYNLSLRFPQMNGLPGGMQWGWDTVMPENVSAIWIDVSPPGPSDRPAGRLLLRHFRAQRWNISCGHAASPFDNRIFPLVDCYGQLTLREWPRKIHSDADLRENKRDEYADLAAHAGPQGWNKYGGWADGPSLNATGHFRTTKHKNRWWLVDPVGNLFWSAGLTCVDICQRSGTAGREHLFEDKGEFGWFDAMQRNLQRKYGADFNNTARKLAHRRLRSWGLNTMASWSEWFITGQGSPHVQTRSPYTINLGYSAPKVLGSSFPDVFSPRFRAGVRAGVQSSAHLNSDPYLLGVFIDNELDWNTHGNASVAELYFRTIKEELRNALPDKLYLGAKQGYPSEPVLRAAAKYADVVSFDHYMYTASPAPGATLGKDIDAPLLFAEFHFGALDVGMLHPGLRPTSSQQQRQEAYKLYLRTALQNPQCVGAHYFQYIDEPTAGRGDGENYQIGWVDATDTPYLELVRAGREVGAALYSIASGVKL